MGKTNQRESKGIGRKENKQLKSDKGGEQSCPRLTTVGAIQIATSEHCPNFNSLRQQKKKIL